MIKPGASTPRSAFRVRSIDRPSVVAVWCVALTLTVPALGQTAAKPKIRASSIATTVPASVGIYAEFNNLGAAKSSAATRNAYRLYELLIGSADVSAGAAQDWRRLLLNSLGLRSGPDARELLSHQLAIAAPSWQRLADGIIVVRLRPNDRLIKKVFAPDSEGFVDSHDGVRAYRTKRILSALTNDKILILAQRRHQGSVYDQAAKLLLGRGGASLGAHPAFNALLRTLPPKRGGLIYLAGNKDKPINFLSAALDNVAIGLYFDADHVELAVRAVRTESTSDGPRASLSLDQLNGLPRTTVAAWCATLDIQSAFRAVVDKRIGEGSPAYLKFLAEALDMGGINDHLFAKLGPGAVIAWDQHLGSGPEVPQLALILESKDAEYCVTTAADAMQLVVEWLDISRRQLPEPRLKFNRSEYLGTTIHELVLPIEIGPVDSGPAKVVFFDPAFAAVGDKFVIAASSDCIRNIIDAHLGLVPRFSELGLTVAPGDADSRVIALAVAQPSLAAQVVESWLKNPQGLMTTWFGQVLGDEPPVSVKNQSTPKLGIGMRPGNKPGTVSVVRVYPRGRAHGRLQPGDQILGINGNLLALTDATVDLRRRMKTPGPKSRWTFRVERQGQVIEVMVPAGRPRRVSQSVTDPTGALRQLQRLFRMIDFSSLRVTQTGPSTISANLKLRFSKRGDAPEKH